MLCRAPRDGEEALHRQTSLPECKSRGPPIGSKPSTMGNCSSKQCVSPKNFPGQQYRGAGWMGTPIWLHQAPSWSVPLSLVSPPSPWPPCSGQLIFLVPPRNKYRRFNLSQGGGTADSWLLLPQQSTKID